MQQHPPCTLQVRPPHLLIPQQRLERRRLQQGPRPLHGSLEVGLHTQKERVCQYVWNCQLPVCHTARVLAGQC